MLKYLKVKKMEVMIEYGIVFICDDGIGFDWDENSEGFGLKIIEDICRLFYIMYFLKIDKIGIYFNLKNDKL